MAYPPVIAPAHKTPIAGGKHLLFIELRTWIGVKEAREELADRHCPLVTLPVGSRAWALKHDVVSHLGNEPVDVTSLERGTETGKRRQCGGGLVIDTRHARRPFNAAASSANPRRRTGRSSPNT